MRLKNTYRFSLITSCYITLIVGICLLPFYLTAQFSPFWIPLLLVVVLITTFLIIQYRVRKYIYRRIKKMFQDVNLGDDEAFNTFPMTTDLEVLSREVERFAQNKNIEINELKIREAYRKEFIGNISHELKTPLFTVQGYILTLLDGAMKDKSVRKKYLQRAEKGVERLINIVKELDMITKLETGNIVLQKSRVNLIELIEHVVDMFEIQAQKKNITLLIDKKQLETVIVLADQERIQQVLTNLIHNSIKYGKKGGSTEVGVQPFSKTKILVRVKDNGEGMEEKHLTRIFERFYRIDTSGSRHEGGSGLGLSIVKHIIEAHKEKVFVQSTYGKGSEFSFTLEKYKP